MISSPITNLSGNATLDESLSFLGQDEIHVLATSNGFLLCCTRLQENPRSYFICNPMNKQFLPLPTPNVQTEVLTHGFVCRSTSPCLDKVHYYKVVRAIGSDYSNPTIEILSSDLPQWKLVNLPCPCRFRFFGRFPYNAIVEGELVYIPGTVVEEGEFGDTGIVIFDQRKHSVELLLYPPEEANFRDYYFGQTDGIIRYAQYAAGQIKVWTLNYNLTDACGWEWSLKHTAQVEATLETYPDFFENPPLELSLSFHPLNPLKLPFMFVAFHPLNPNIIFIDRHQGKMLLYDLENSKLEFNFSKSGEGFSTITYFLILMA